MVKIRYVSIAFYKSIALFAFLTLFCLVGCCTITPSPSVSIKTQHSGFSSIPNGTGTGPEIGIANKPLVDGNPLTQLPTYSAIVTFTRSTTYDRALQIIGDLGLQTFNQCGSTWAPEDGKASYPILTVTAGANSAPLWLKRLQAMPEIAQALPEGAHSCPIDRGGPIPFLDQRYEGTLIQVSFTSNTAYLKAWESLNSLGFRLADPCYESARALGHKPTWPVTGEGEENSFAQTHTLVLATTRFNATTWQQQLHATSGVKQFTTLSGSTCH